MLNISASLAAVLVFLPTAIAQAAVWAQCGGQGFTGPTTCVAGAVCYKENQFFSNCYPTATSTAKANTVAKSLGGKLYFGSATDNPELSDTAYINILSDNAMFGQITPENSMKWSATEPSRGVFNFTGGDAIAAVAKKNGQLLRGHSCVSYDQLPSWVTARNFSAPALQTILEAHCRTVVSHYAGEVSSYAWDVVNEPFNDDGTLRSFVFSDALGISYITDALVAARAADPNAKLYINENNIESAGAKSTALINLVKALKAAGTPIDGIGIQGHLISAGLPSQADLIANFEAFTALGVEIAITELDIRTGVPQPNFSLLQEETDYQTITSACKAVAGCVGVTLWDYTDKYSWIPSAFPGQGRALPWDENLIPKIVYDGIIAGFTN
ncbi:endo-1,4-beta-xylanase C precursor [Mycena latifolia]|nr:endo-1,4-beta-xylanase C precursor [Mycena latifolia]